MANVAESYHTIPSRATTARVGGVVAERLAVNKNFHPPSIPAVQKKEATALKWPRRMPLQHNDDLGRTKINELKRLFMTLYVTHCDTSKHVNATNCHGTSIVVDEWQGILCPLRLIQHKDLWLVVLTSKRRIEQ